MVNTQTSFAKDMLKKSELDNLASMDWHRNGDGFIWKGLLEDMMTSFYTLAYKSVFFKLAHKLFASNARESRHQTETSRDSRMSLRYSLTEWRRGWETNRDCFVRRGGLQ